MIAKAPNRDKRDLWPWKHWMTIGIGCIATELETPDCFILASDELGSFGDAFSTRRHAKMTFQPEHNLVAVCAESVENASELLGAIAMEWNELPARTFGGLQQGIQNAVTLYKHHRFFLEVLPRYGIVAKSGDWAEIVRRIGIDQQLHEEWNAQTLGCDVVVGTFDMYNHAMLYYICSDASVHTIGQPGFTAIGSGGANAMFWLAYRQQCCGMSVLRSAYHVYEAKLMAEQSPFVGRDDIEIAVCTPRKSYILTQQRPEHDGCAVSLVRLKEMWQRYGPPDTSVLDTKP
jgi:hypothetical protein